ncbi:MAG: SIMPL domain-containing protein [Desulfobacterales bacterium]
MPENHAKSAFILGLFIFLGLSVLGWFLGSQLIEFKKLERSVTVKGLSEREYPADIALWPIQFVAATNNLTELYSTLESNTVEIVGFLERNGIHSDEITVASPVVTDKLAQSYGDNSRIEFRYSATQTVTVYSPKVDTVRAVIRRLVELGKKGIAFSGGDYHSTTEYIFTRLNDVKPEMIEEATTKAREVAQKFAQDSSSRLGKIRRASQGQFTIEDRDRNTPYVKKVRVVSTVEYYLSD